MPAHGNAKALTISYVINQVLTVLGNAIIPCTIAAKAMADQVVTDGHQNSILAASKLLQSWVPVVPVTVVIAAVFIYTAIGKQIVKERLTV